MGLYEPRTLADSVGGGRVEWNTLPIFFFPFLLKTDSEYKVRHCFKVKIHFTAWADCRRNGGNEDKYLLSAALRLSLFKWCCLLVLPCDGGGNTIIINLPARSVICNQLIPLTAAGFRSPLNTALVQLLSNYRSAQQLLLGMAGLSESGFTGWSSVHQVVIQEQYSVWKVIFECFQNRGQMCNREILACHLGFQVKMQSFCWIFDRFFGVCDYLKMHSHRIFANFENEHLENVHVHVVADHDSRPWTMCRWFAVHCHAREVSLSMRIFSKSQITVPPTGLASVLYYLYGFQNVASCTRKYLKMVTYTKTLLLLSKGPKGPI